MEIVSIRVRPKEHRRVIRRGNSVEVHTDVGIDIKTKRKWSLPSYSQEENKTTMADETQNIREKSLAIQESPLILREQCNQNIINTTTNQFSTLTENSIFLCKPHKIKTALISSRQFQVAGEDWLSFILLRYLISLYESFTTYVINTKVKYCQKIFGLIISIAYFVLYVICLCKEGLIGDDKLLVYTLMGFSVIYMFLLVLNLYYMINDKGEPLGYLLLYLIFWVYYYGATVFAGILLLVDGFVPCGIIFIVTFYIIDPINSFIFTVILAASPLLAAQFFVELLIRLVLCKMNSRYIIPIKREHTYGLYQFPNSSITSFDIYRCAICLSKFDEENKDLVITKCLTKHIFHEKCILDWYEMRHQCPICRSDLKFLVD